MDLEAQLAAIQAEKKSRNQQDSVDLERQLAEAQKQKELQTLQIQNDINDQIDRVTKLKQIRDELRQSYIEAAGEIAEFKSNKERTARDYENAEMQARAVFEAASNEYKIQKARELIKTYPDGVVEMFGSSEVEAIIKDERFGQYVANLELIPELREIPSLQQIRAEEGVDSSNIRIKVERISYLKKTLKEQGVELSFKGDSRTEDLESLDAIISEAEAALRALELQTPEGRQKILKEEVDKVATRKGSFGMVARRFDPGTGIPFQVDESDLELVDRYGFEGAKSVLVAYQKEVIESWAEQQLGESEKRQLQESREVKEVIAQLPKLIEEEIILERYLDSIGMNDWRPFPESRVTLKDILQTIPYSDPDYNNINLADLFKNILVGREMQSQLQRDPASVSKLDVPGRITFIKNATESFKILTDDIRTNPDKWQQYYLAINTRGGTTFDYKSVQAPFIIAPDKSIKQVKYLQSFKNQGYGIRIDYDSVLTELEKKEADIAIVKEKSKEVADALIQKNLIKAVHAYDQEGRKASAEVSEFVNTHRKAVDDLAIISGVDLTSFHPDIQAAEVKISRYGFSLIDDQSSAVPGLNDLQKEWLSQNKQLPDWLSGKFEGEYPYRESISKFNKELEDKLKQKYQDSDAPNALFKRKERKKFDEEKSRLVSNIDMLQKLQSLSEQLLPLLEVDKKVTSLLDTLTRLSRLESSDSWNYSGKYRIDADKSYKIVDLVKELRTKIREAATDVLDPAIKVAADRYDARQKELDSRK